MLVLYCISEFSNELDFIVAASTVLALLLVIFVMLCVLGCWKYYKRAKKHNSTKSSTQSPAPDLLTENNPAYMQIQGPNQARSEVSSESFLGQKLGEPVYEDPDEFLQSQKISS